MPKKIKEICRKNLYKSLIFICMYKNQLHASLRSWEIEWFYKIFILGTLRVPGYGNQKRYQFAENFDFYLHAKNQILTKYHCAKLFKKTNTRIPSNTSFRRTHLHRNGQAQIYRTLPVKARGSKNGCINI